MIPQNTVTPEASQHPVKDTTPPKPPFSQDTKQSGSSKPRLAGGGIFRRNGQHTIFNSTSDSQEEQGIKPETSVAKEKYTTNSAAAPSACDDNFQALPVPNNSLTTISITLFDLSRRWESLKTSRDRWTLLAVCVTSICLHSSQPVSFAQNNVPPAHLPSLFKTSLETSFLMSILQTFGGVLHEYPDSLELRAAVKDYMIRFPQVPRFSTVVLLMSPQEKAVVQSLWDNWGDQSEDQTQTRAKLAWRIA